MKIKNSSFFMCFIKHQLLDITLSENTHITYTCCNISPSLNNIVSPTKYLTEINDLIVVQNNKFF